MGTPSLSPTPERRPVLHTIKCEAECQGPQSTVEQQVVAERDYAYADVAALGAQQKLMCEECGEAAMRVVYTALHTTRSAGTTRLSNGAIVESPDNTVCALGRGVVGTEAFIGDNLEPGETRQITRAGAGIEVSKSEMGGEIQVRRTDFDS